MTSAAPAAAGLRFRRRSTREPLALDASLEIGAGGEARVYAVPGDRRLVAKVYHQPTVERARKVALMVDQPPELRDPRAALAWPADLLLNERGRFAGFVMPRAEGPRLFELYNPITRRRSGAHCDHAMLHRAGAHLAAAFDALHARGYVIGDVNGSNVLLAPGGVVTLVDADSFQVRDPDGTIHRSRVGKAEFTPPELQGKVFGEIDRTPEHDRFGLAALLFLALMEGTHPFAGRMEVRSETPPVEERIRRGLFPHHGHPEIHPPKLAPSFAVLDPEIRTLFVRCFAEGHGDPAARPTAAEWKSALALAGARMETCAANRRHRFGRHLPACPWCERTRLLRGRDPFPADPRGVARESRPAPKPVSTRPISGAAKTLSVAVPVVAPAPAAAAPSPLPAPAPAPSPAVPAPSGPAAISALLGAAVKRPAAWLPPALALFISGPAGMKAAALLLSLAALTLVSAGIPRRSGRHDGPSVVAASWIVTVVVWFFFLVADAGAGASGPAPDVFPAEAPSAPGAYRVQVAGPAPLGLDAPPVLLNAPHAELMLAAESPTPSGSPSQGWSVRVSVLVNRSGLVDQSTVLIYADRSAISDAAGAAAATARFQPLTIAGTPVSARVWLQMSFEP